MYTLSVKDTFDAAHYLRNYNGKCANLHGHTWTVKVEFQYEYLVGGMGKDFIKLKKILKDIINILDHTNLNDNIFLQGKNPTAENIAKRVYDDIVGQTMAVKSVTIWETSNSECRYEPNE